MTYCLGISLDAGLVMMSDSRTNAGVDHVAQFQKMRVWEQPGERAIILLSAGNLAITQAVVSHLEDKVRLPKAEAAARKKQGTLLTCPGMTVAAQLVGDAVRKVYDRDAERLKQQGSDFVASFLLAGQIKGGPMRLFMVYSAGNFIEASSDTNFLQIGETKYGKPILDRVVNPLTPLPEAVKCALVSVDSTMRSNLSVGCPIDVAVIRTDECRISWRRRYAETDPYWGNLRRQWGDGVKTIFGQLDDPDLSDGK
ncbi:proteasome-type protease [Insolitispirillum peregrinum]|uniref:Putative proteasome-type protease n=1 Tax=Insolitispirillum peregrinum TaxID=80876 RepID=A0A1N7LBW8_9PROT|nr:proteasome-type protease [Insolitispirillum peregrinum]SIS71281.1 putative proteasome-type protease [Insolitispirillum peregrinum]